MATISQEEIDQIIAAGGGGELAHGIAGKRTVKNPKYNPRDLRSTEPETIELDIQQWVAPDGRVIQAVQMPDGAWDLIRNEPPKPKPPAAAGAAQPPKEKDEGGRRYVWTPNPGGPDAGGKWVDVGPSPVAGSEPKSQVVQGGDGAYYTVTQTPGVSGGPPTVTVTNAQGQPVPGNVVPGKPDATKPTTATKTEPLKGAPGWQVGQRSVKDANGNETTETYYIDPQGNRTTTPPPDADGGKKYTNVTQDKETGKWYGLKPDGSGWEEIPGGPGSKPAGATGPGSSGPALPTMVVGQSQVALRQYRDQLQAEVAAGRQTQAWADNRWNEAKEVATFSIQEAQLMQQERQSNMNASINLATTKLNHETGGIKTALEFALAINGKLPPGSPLGGQAFAALLGLNMIAAQRSGIYDIKPGAVDNRSLAGQQIDAAAGTARSTTNNEIIRLTNPGDPKVLEAQRAEVAAQLEAEVAPKPEPIFRPQPVAPEPVSATPAPAAPPIAAPALSSPVAPAAPTPQPTVTAPPGAAPGLPLPPTGTLPGAAPQSEVGQPGDPRLVAPVVNPITGEPTGLPQPAPAFNMPGEPGFTPGQPMGQAQPPQEEFAVLNQFQPQPVPQMTAPQSSPVAVPTEQEPLALMRAQAAAIPPWRLDEQTYQKWRAAGVTDEEIFRVPSMAGVMA